MLLYLALFIPAISASFIPYFQRHPTFNDFCNTDPLDHCRPDVLLKGFPENEAEVELTCNVLTKFQECILNYVQVCRVEIPNQGVFESGVINKLCDRDGSLYGEFVDNTKCLSEIVAKLYEDHICRTKVDAAKEKYPERFEKVAQIFKTENVTEEVRKLRQCVDAGSQLGCFVSDTKERCGVSAEHFVMQIVGESKVFDTICAPDHLPVLEDAMELLDFDFK